MCRYDLDMLTYRVTAVQLEKSKEVSPERKNHDEIIWTRTKNVYHDGGHSRIFPVIGSLR